MDGLILVVVFLAFLVVVVVIVRDDTELTRIAAKGLVETMHKALSLFRD